MDPLARALADQFAAAFDDLRDAIGKFPEDEWAAGASHDQVPARRAFHAAACVTRHCGMPGTYPPAGRFDAVPVYPSREEVLACVDAAAAQISASLSRVTGAELAAPPRRARGTLHTLLARHLYALRHLQHHVGQLSSTLMERRLRPMKWH